MGIACRRCSVMMTARSISTVLFWMLFECWMIWRNVSNSFVSSCSISGQELLGPESTGYLRERNAFSSGPRMIILGNLWFMMGTDFWKQNERNHWNGLIKIKFDSGLDGNSVYSVLTHSLTARHANWHTQDSNKRPPQLSFPSQLLDGVPAVAEALSSLSL